MTDKEKYRHSFAKGALEDNLNMNRNSFGHTITNEEESNILPESEMIISNQSGSIVANPKKTIWESEEFKHFVVQHAGQTAAELFQSQDVDQISKITLDFENAQIEEFVEDIPLYNHHGRELNWNKIIKEQIPIEEEIPLTLEAFNQAVDKEILNNPSKFSRATPKYVTQNNIEHFCVEKTCRAVLPANAKYCSECGKAQMAKFCINCGYNFNTTEKFCPECGEKR